jgi:tetratricopeptide (TPR) repeat protein
MSKANLTIALAAAPVLLAAQNVNVVNAYNHMKANELPKAVEYIELATQDPKTGISEKTWRYRGEIYFRIFTGDDQALKAQFPDAASKSVESYFKANEFDAKGSYKRDNDRLLRQLQGLSLNAGNEAFTNKRFDDAIGLYAVSERVAKGFGEADTNAIFNSALAFDSKGDNAGAIRRYRDAIAAGYPGSEVYRYLASVHRRSDDMNGAIEATRDGLKRFPKDKDLNMDFVTYLLQADRSEEAETSVQNALKIDPDNAVLWSVLGSLYDKRANAASEAGNEADMNMWYNKAEEAYTNSITKDPTVIDAYFNIGVLYNNRAAFEYEKCNKLRSDKDYLKCKEGADAVYMKALPYFEKAHELKPDDNQVIGQLMKLYAKMNDQAKYEVMKAKMTK